MKPLAPSEVGGKSNVDTATQPSQDSLQTQRGGGTKKPLGSASAIRASNETEAKRLIGGETGPVSVGDTPDLVGTPVTNAMRERHQADIDRVLELSASGEVNRADLRIDHPLTDNNRVERLIDGNAVFPRLVEDIRSARSVVNLLGFIFRADEASDEVIDALVDRAQNGVEVNLLIDRAGLLMACAGRKSVYDRTMDRLKELEAAGGHVHLNRVVDHISGWAFNHLDHRKIVTIDGHTAYTGGMGMGIEYKRDWHDSMTRYEGGVAQQLSIDFLLRWLHLGRHLHGPAGADAAALRDHYFPDLGEHHGELVARTIPQGPYAQVEAVGHKDDFQSITAAYLRELQALEPGDVFWCENPYITDRRILRELAAAAERGAEVHAIMPAENDHALSRLMARSYYAKLIRSGVHVYEWQGMTHMKTAASSRGWGVDGSYNLDSLSAHHNWEEVVEYRDAREIQLMFEQLQADGANSREMTLEDLSPAGWLAGKIAHAVMAYFY